MKIEKCYTTGWEDYSLLDAGNGKKLERWGEIITIRPEVQAYFKPEFSSKQWYDLAHMEFIQKTPKSGEWKELKPTEKNWTITYQTLQFQLQTTAFKHVGLFPEQKYNWDTIANNLDEAKRFLNLFAYTGAASVVAKNTGAEVYHVDSVKQLISWAKENMELSSVKDIRWVLEDAFKFALREVKRGNKYHGIIMDPPVFGLGAKGERWKIENKLPELLDLASQLLTKDGFLIVNTYTPAITAEMLSEWSKKFFFDRKIQLKELWMKSETNKELYYGLLLTIQ